MCKELRNPQNKKFKKLNFCVNSILLGFDLLQGN